MICFNNNTTKEQFVEYLNFYKHQLSPMQLLSVNPNAIKGKKLWEVTDKFNNCWMILFNGNVNEWKITGYFNNNPFEVYVLMKDSYVEIHNAYHNGRTIKADRLLKKYVNLASMVNCYHKFGYLKF